MVKGVLRTNGIPSVDSPWLRRLVGAAIVIEISILIAAGVFVSVHQQEVFSPRMVSGVMENISKMEAD